MVHQESGNAMSPRDSGNTVICKDFDSAMYSWDCWDSGNCWNTVVHWDSVNAFGLWGLWGLWGLRELLEYYGSLGL